jgi:hypothetical protein
MLPLLFAIPQSSRSPSPSPSFLPPIPKPVSSLGTFITAQVAARVESQLRDIYDKTLDHAMDLRNTADGGFFDEMQDHQLDVRTIMEDSIAELLREIDGKLVELRESAAAIVEEAGEQADDVYNDVCARLDGLLDYRPSFVEAQESPKVTPSLPQPKTTAKHQATPPLKGTVRHGEAILAAILEQLVQIVYMLV